MTYATELIQQYRLALRYLWNTHFWSDQSYRDVDSLLRFKQLKLPLFISLVAKVLGPDLESPSELFGDDYKVVPKVIGCSRVFPPMRVDVGFPDRPGYQWKELAGEFTNDNLKLTLLDLFDWNELDWRDFRYFRVRIDGMQGHPDKVGREGLIDAVDVDVLWDSRAILGMPMR